MFGHDENDNQQQDDNTAVAPTPDTTKEDAVASTSDAPIIDTPVNDVSGLSSASSKDADLLSLKKQAIEELAPLVDHLDQTADEKFKTTMMMIQATDSSDLIKSAYQAALKIEDDKVRAQALLDIVNEINYFTQK
ncbi:MAG: hypothetical protein WCJ24_00990 [Candidatus Saccharibacteria bacterium]